jgi:hypothetical protein
MLFRIVSVVLFGVCAGQASRLEVSGTIAANTTWSADTIAVTAEVQVETSAVLTIAPGTYVEFQGHYKLIVRGGLIAAGAANDTITFTARPGYDWYGIEFTSPNFRDSSRLAYCRLQNGRADGSANNDRCGGAVRIINYRMVEIDHALITHNLALYDGGGIYGSGQYLLLLTNSEISDNAAYERGGGVCASGGDFIVQAARISGNTALYGGGIYCAGFGGAIRNTVIANNTVSGASAYGGGIYCYNNNPVITNVTIAGNAAVASYNGWGGGIYCNSAQPLLTNTILWGNTATHYGRQVYLFDTNADPGFYYCLVQGNTAAFGGTGAGANYYGAYENCLDTDPLFVHVGSQNYMLQPVSSCLNAGTPDTAGLALPAIDLAGNPRIYDGNEDRIDMGAYEYQGDLSVPVHSASDGKRLYGTGAARSFVVSRPCPGSNVTFRLQAPSGADIAAVAIFDLSGRKAANVWTGSLHAGTHTFVWDNREVPAGSYVARVRVDDRMESVRFVLMR